MRSTHEPCTWCAPWQSGKMLSDDDIILSRSPPRCVHPQVLRGDVCVEKVAHSHAPPRRAVGLSPSAPPASGTHIRRTSTSACADRRLTSYRTQAERAVPLREKHRRAG